MLEARSAANTDQAGRRRDRPREFIGNGIPDSLARSLKRGIPERSARRKTDEHISQRALGSRSFREDATEAN